MDEMKIKEILNLHSDNIPINVYKSLVTDISKLFPNSHKFCYDCGIKCDPCINNQLFNHDGNLASCSTCNEPNIVELTKSLWNQKADGFNQWHELDIDEQLDLINEQFPINIKETKKALENIEDIDSFEALEIILLNKKN
jgi:hypothetical protein